MLNSYHIVTAAVLAQSPQQACCCYVQLLASAPKCMMHIQKDTLYLKDKPSS
jgi:hypothetical protein